MYLYATYSYHQNTEKHYGNRDGNLMTLYPVRATVAERHVNNPFGTLKGQVAAWMNVYNLAQAQGGALH